MFAKLRGKLNTSKTQSPEDQHDEGNDEKNQQGFICPMCMESLPGPAELQLHFEKVHSEERAEGNLIDISDKDETDALPESSVDELLPTTQVEFGASRLDFSADSNVPDSEKEILLLQQEMADLTAALKEEKWYTGQLKLELNKVSQERDKLEEEKAMVEDEFSSQLRSAEQGYLQVVEENNKLKDELKFADYNTTKERHEKLKQQMIAYQNEAEEERQRRQAMEDNFKLLQNDFQEGRVQASKIEEQLQARPSSDQVSNLQNEIQALNSQINAITVKNRDEMKQLNDEWQSKVDALNANISKLNVTVHELQTEKNAKESQILTMQTAVDSATVATGLSKQQASEKGQQILDLQHRAKELESTVKEKENQISISQKEINDLKIALTSESATNEKLQSELLALTTSTEDLRHQVSMHLATIKEQEGNLAKEKEEIRRLEKERVELIAKIEAGEGTDTVIQQLSQEKVKLLEAITSIEKSTSEQVQQHVNEMEIVRQEKSSLATEMQKLQQEKLKLEKSLHDIEGKLQLAETENLNLKEENKNKNDELFKLESASMGKQAELSNTVDEQKLTIDKLNGEMLTTKEQLEKAMFDLKNSDHNQTQQASWIETKNKSISEMTAKISALHEQLNTKNAEITSSKEELETLSTTFQLLKRESETKAAQLSEELSELKSKNLVLSSELSKVDEEKEILEKKYEQMQTEKEHMEKVESELIQRNAVLVKDAEELSVKIKTNEDFRNELERQISSLHENHGDELLKKTEELSNLHIDLNNAKTNLEAEIKLRNVAENEILDHKTKCSKLDKLLEQKDEVLHEVQSKLEVTENELKKPCDSCKNYEIQLCRLQEATKDQSGQIAKLKDEQKSLEDKLNSKEEDISSLKAEHDTFVSGSEEKMQEVNRSIETLTTEKLNVAIELKNANDAIRELKTLMDNLTTEKEGFTTALSNLEASKKEIELERSNLEKDLLDLAVDLQTKEEDLEKAQADAERKEVEAQEEKANIQQTLEEKQMQLTKEIEAHASTKVNSQKIQDVLREESIHLKNKLEKTKADHVSLNKAKDELEKRFSFEISNLKLNEKKLQQELSSKDRRINEHEIKMQESEQEINDLKGDVTVLEAQIQNKNEEKKALLDRVLNAEEQHKKTKQKLSEANKRVDQALSGLQELGQENQNLQVQQAIKSNRQWEKDTDIVSCKKCEKAFSLTIRKHHCRNCGLIYCSECSAYQAIVASSKKPVRVCQSCSVELSNLRGSNVRRLSNSSMQSVQSNR